VSPKAIPPVVAVEEAIVKTEEGVLVPTPIFPLANTEKSEEVAPPVLVVDAISNNLSVEP
jgi:hypothetical protein